MQPKYLPLNERVAILERNAGLEKEEKINALETRVKFLEEILENKFNIYVPRNLKITGANRSREQKLLLVIK